MKELRRYVFPAFGFSMLVIVLMFAATTSSQAVPSDKDVRVINTTSEAVPTSAQGTTQIAGNVAVSSLPAVQFAGGSSVSISNTPTVQVGNTSANPVPVVNLGAAAALQPFQTDTSATQGPGSNVSTITLATVPTGKTLVIEFVTATGQVPPGQHVELMEIISVAPPFGGASHQLLINPQPDAVIGDALFRSSQTVKIYAQGGSTVQSILRRSSSAGNATFGVSISGYLVDE